MKITFFYRHPFPAQFSIEEVFTIVSQAMPAGIKCTKVVSRFNSVNIFQFVYNIIEASLRQGDINHITGDIHYATYLLKRNKTLLTILDCRNIEKLSGLKQWLFRALWFDIPIYRSRRVSVISDFTAKQLIHHCAYAREKICIVYCPVNPAYTPNPKSFNLSKPIILQVGTGNNKNLERVAEALTSIPCRLDIVGKLSDSQIEILNKFNIDYTNAHSLSHIQVLQKYQTCDLVVFASTYEGFGMPIIEANAVGRPVITSNICSMPEVAGNAACIVDPFDISSIRTGILKIINEPEYREDLIKKGYKNVERFKAEKIAGDYVKIYQEMLD